MRGEAPLSAFVRPKDRSLPIPHVFNQTSGGPVTCHFVCGYLGCDQFPFNPLLEALPRMFRARASTSSQTWLANLLRTAVDETVDDRAGRETLLARLAERLSALLDILDGDADLEPGDSDHEEGRDLDPLGGSRVGKRASSFRRRQRLRGVHRSRLKSRGRWRG